MYFKLFWEPIKYKVSVYKYIDVISVTDSSCLSKKLEADWTSDSCLSLRLPKLSFSCVATMVYIREQSRIHI